MEYHDKINSNRTGFYSSLFLSLITLITFGFAITAIPISGAFCPADCKEYPYLDTLAYFPAHYIWMFLAEIMLLTYVIFMVSVHCYASERKKIFSYTGVSFALISAVILLLAYFIQFSVVPASLKNGETEGITLLTQYNPHGIFIAMEELGYLMMSLSFLCMAPVFNQKNRVETAVRWVFISAFLLTVLAFVVVSLNYGIVRKDRFEVMVISIDWLALITSGILTGIIFKRALKDNKRLNAPQSFETF